MTQPSATPPVDDLRNAAPANNFDLVLDAAMVSGICRVVRTELVTPRMKRVTVSGEALRDMDGQWSPGQEVRVMFPPGGERDLGPDGPISFHGDVKPLLRTYTARRYDPATLELDLDFVLHDHPGVAGQWALGASAGHRLAIAVQYPEASPRDIPADCYILVGDETAIAAIGASIETLPNGARVLAFLEVVDGQDEQRFTTAADAKLTWLHRGDAAAGTTQLLERAVRELPWPDGKVFVWVTGEVRMASAVRRFLREERGFTRHDYKVQAYWRRGMTETERVERLTHLASELMSTGVDLEATYNERGMNAEDPTLSHS